MSNSGTRAGTSVDASSGASAHQQNCKQSFPAETSCVKPAKPYGDLISQLGRTLSAANHYLSHLMTQKGVQGLVPSHGDILVNLFAHESMTMAALAESIGKDPSTVTVLVRKLIDAGYVKTEKSSLDRRVTEVSLTGKGQALKADIAFVNEQLLTAMEEGLSSEELSAARKTLMKMRDNFEKASQ